MDIAIKSLTKKYKKKTALDDFNLEFTDGIYGLLGPNGAGKSTLMNLLVTNISPTSGSISCGGTDIYKLGMRYKGLIGYMPQQQNMYPFFTGRRFMNYMAALKGIKKKGMRDEIDALLRKVNLYDAADKRIGEYSGGMKQRVLIAQALLGDPKLLIFDEPTAGLDPKERIRIRNLISENSAGRTVIIATHVVQDIEYIADKILLLKDGRLVSCEDADTLTEGIAGKVWETEVNESDVTGYEEKYKVSALSRRGGRVRIRFISETDESGTAEEVSPSLEDVYLYTFG